jgi:hypothetical protein
MNRETPGHASLPARRRGSKLVEEARTLLEPFRMLAIDKFFAFAFRTVERQNLAFLLKTDH